ncbi:hypothetical protein HZH66_003654 [Vespula vulgaris]|uniref:Ketosynthase family 3 (KS3) domain-containing protein n=1 Tax=Vespula vulgaris TaxID=7454 RepID=A0A834NER1_VESVU|nr:hypothetical protein HZH66_003654 [Vespula vulgaris]
MTGYQDNKKSYKFLKYANPEPGEEVVISGLAGNSDIPKHFGKIQNIEKFDASFFRIHFKQAHTMDPMSRMMLEHTYEAIIDSGINPEDLRGTRTGVFANSCFSDSESDLIYKKVKADIFGITSCGRDMMAQSISYWLGVTGPSYNVDTGCSSTLYAMDQAYRSIRSGECDYAIVSGSNLCLHPYTFLHFVRLGVLNQDGRCKVFDEGANGYTRSECVSVAFLQKAKTAKRIYATIIHAKTNCDGYKKEGIAFPSKEMQSTLLKKFYKECGISTACIPYIEAHGTGTKN